MKLESTQQGRPGDSRQEPDELDQKVNKNRQDPDSSHHSRVPDPPDPDNLPIDYLGLREIEWP